MQAAAAHRQFRVHARHTDSHHAFMVSEASFEAAAVAYIENAHPALSEPEVSIIVHECATGHEHCFRIDLHTGETAPCG